MKKSIWIPIVILVIAGYFAVQYFTNEKNPENKPVETVTPTSTENGGGEITPEENGSVSLDLSTELARTYATILSRELTLPANFAGHYRIALVGCGSGCGYHILLDKNTGKVYPTPANEDLMMYSSVGFSVSSSDFTLFYTDGKTKVYSWNGSAFVQK